MTLSAIPIRVRELTSFKDIKSGLTWNWPDIPLERDYQNYAEGKLGGMFSAQPSIENGLALIENKEDIAAVNYLGVCVDFYRDAMFAEWPVITSESPERLAFIESVMSSLMDQLQRALQWRVIKGRAVLMVDSRGVHAVDPSFYQPVRAEYDRDETIAHLLAYTYADESVAGQTGVVSTQQTDTRIRFVFFERGQPATYAVHKFAGWTVGELLESGPVDLREMVVFGRGLKDSFFVDAVPLVRELAIRRTIMDKIMNRFGAPHLVAPNNAPSDFKLDPAGSLLRRDNTGGGYEYLTFDADLAVQKQRAEAITDEIYTLLGIPPVALGVNAGRGESGAARDRLMFAALAKVGRLRRAVDGVIPLLLDALNAPAGDTKIVWPRAPLATYEEKVAQVVQLVGAGILPIPTAQKWLGIEASEIPVVPGDAA